jgi:hypothetical protein
MARLIEIDQRQRAPIGFKGANLIMGSVSHLSTYTPSGGIHNVKPVGIARSIDGCGRFGDGAALGCFGVRPRSGNKSTKAATQYANAQIPSSTDETARRQAGRADESVRR